MVRYVVRCGSNNGHQMIHVQKRLDYVLKTNRSRLNGHHDWGDLYDRLMGTKIFTFVMK